jgi:hypothetical protein
MSRVSGIRLSRGALVVIALSTVGLVACGSSDSKVVETNDGKVTVDKDGKSVTIEGENGASATFGGKKVPDGFPSEVPLPEGLKLKTSAGGSQGGKQFFTIGYDLGSKSPQNAAADYKSQLEGAGFTIGNSASFGSGNATIENLSATGKGYRVAATGTGTGKLFTLVVTSTD